MLKIIATVALLAGSFLGWGLWLMRKSRRALVTTLCSLNPDTIAAHAQECREVFQSKLNTELSFENYEQSAWVLDRALKSNATVKAFEKVGEHYNYVVKVGCFLGELIRRHTNAKWNKPPEKAPNLVIDLGAAEMKAFPFSKVQRHSVSGDEGDLVAYVTMLIQGTVPTLTKSSEDVP